MRAITSLTVAIVLILGVSAAPARPISPNEVTLSNLDAFKAQMIRDLPTGTSKAEVEAYLGRSGMRCSFTDKHWPGGWGNMFHCRISNIGLRGGFTADLAIKIHLDATDQVDNVFFKVDYE